MTANCGLPCSAFRSVSVSILTTWPGDRPCFTASRRLERASSRLWSSASTHARSYIRSEEHTSELQSHLNLVCRLLLEKKKTVRFKTNKPLNRVTDAYSVNKPTHTSPPVRF